MRLLQSKKRTKIGKDKKKGGTPKQWGGFGPVSQAVPYSTVVTLNQMDKDIMRCTYSLLYSGSTKFYRNRTGAVLVYLVHEVESRAQHFQQYFLQIDYFKFQIIVLKSREHASCELERSGNSAKIWKLQ